MWKGLGINYTYKGAGANLVNDMTLLNAAGFRMYRMLTPVYSSSGTYGMDGWKTDTQYVLAMKPAPSEVYFGLTFSGFSVANKAAHLAAAVSLANWYMAQTLPNAAFRFYLSIGNEESNHISDGSTKATVRAHMRDVYTAVKAIVASKFPQIIVTYSMAGIQEAKEFYDDFHDLGLAYPWDNASVNLYNLYGNRTPQAFDTNFSTVLATIQSYFGIYNTQLSEFGPDAEGYSEAYWGDKEIYEAQVLQDVRKIIEAGVQKAYFFNYMNSIDLGEYGCITAGAPNQSGVYGRTYFNPWWYSIRGVRKPYIVGTKGV